MTVYRIATSTDPKVSNYVERATLDGREYVLAFDFNPRDRHWYLGLRDQDGASIREGIKIVINWPLLRRIVDDRCPPGEIYAHDLSESHTDPDFTDLGTRVVLRYYDAAELATVPP